MRILFCFVFPPWWRWRIRILLGVCRYRFSHCLTDMTKITCFLILAVSSLTIPTLTGWDFALSNFHRLCWVWYVLCWLSWRTSLYNADCFPRWAHTDDNWYSLWCCFCFRTGIHTDTWYAHTACCFLIWGALSNAGGVYQPGGVQYYYVFPL